MSRSASLARQSAPVQALRLQCPSCAKLLISKDRPRAGKKVRCPNCGKRFEARPHQKIVEAPTEVVPPSDATPPGVTPYLSASRLGVGLAAVVVLGLLVTSLAYAGRSGDDVRRAAQFQEQEAERQKQKEEKDKEKNQDDQRKARISSLLDQARQAKSKESFGDAESLFLEALQLDRDNAAAQAGLKDTQDQRAAKDRMLKTVEQLFTQGKELEERGEGKHLEEAEAIYEEILKRQPDEPEAKRRLLVVKQRLVVVRVDQQFVACMSAAAAFIHAKQWEEAQKKFLEALGLRPGDPRATAGLKDVKETLRQIEQNLAEAQKAAADKKDKKDKADKAEAKSKQDSVLLAEGVKESLKLQTYQPPQQDSQSFQSTGGGFGGTFPYYPPRQPPRYPQGNMQMGGGSGVGGGFNGGPGRGPTRPR